MLLETEKRWRKMSNGERIHRFERYPLYSIVYMEWVQLSKKRGLGVQDDEPKSYEAYHRKRMMELIKEKKEWLNGSDN